MSFKKLCKAAKFGCKVCVIFFKHFALYFNCKACKTLLPVHFTLQCTLVIIHYQSKPFKARKRDQIRQNSCIARARCEVPPVIFSKLYIYFFLGITPFKSQFTSCFYISEIKPPFTLVCMTTFFQHLQFFLFKKMCFTFLKILSACNKI